MPPTPPAVLHAPSARSADPDDAEGCRVLAALEDRLGLLDTRLGQLGQALGSQDSQALEQAAQALQQVLSAAVDDFRQAGHHGSLPAALRQRLAQASGRIAAQREGLARAQAGLGRALDLLLPRSAPVYGPAGQRLGHSSAGHARA